MYLSALRHIVKRFGLGGALIVGGRLSFLLMTFVLAKTCSPKQFGLFTVAIASSQVLAVLASFGTGPTAQAIIAGALAHNQNGVVWRYVRFSIVTTSAGSCLVGIGAAILGFGLHRHGSVDTAHAAYAAAILSPVMAMSFLREFLARSFEQTVMAFGPRDIGWSLCVTVMVLIAPWTRETIVASGTAVLALIESVAVYSLWQTSIKPLGITRGSPEISKELTEKSWVSRSLAVMANYLGGFSFERVDVVVVGVMADLAAAGIYGVASRLAPLISTGQRFVVPTLTPRVARALAMTDKNSLRHEVFHGALASLLVALPATLVIWLFTRQILDLFGARFAGGIWPLRILALGHLSVAIGSSFGVVTMVGPQPWRYAMAIWIALVPCVVLLPFAIWMGGTIGAATVTCGGMLIYNSILVGLAVGSMKPMHG
jgi:O-antigen/teichoic acid export membrane protein